MQLKNKKTLRKSVLTILLAVVMICTNLPVLSELQVVNAEGVTDNRTNSLQSSFATGGLTKVFEETYESYAENAEPTSLSLHNNANDFTSSTFAEHVSYKVVTEENNKVFRIGYDGSASAGPVVRFKAVDAAKKTKGVIRYDFKIDANATLGAIYLPSPRITGDTRIGELIITKSSGKNIFRVNNSSNETEISFGQWYTVEIKFDTEAGKISVYLDDQNGNIVSFEDKDLHTNTAASNVLDRLYVSFGKTTNAAYVLDNLEFYAYEAYAGISINAANSTIKVGDTTTLTTVYTTAAEGLTFPCTGVTYTSSDDTIATVAADGTVTGVSAGTATITVTPPTASGGAAMTVVITVEAEGSPSGSEIIPAFNEDFSGTIPTNRYDTFNDSANTGATSAVIVDGALQLSNNGSATTAPSLNFRLDAADKKSKGILISDFKITANSSTITVPSIAEKMAIVQVIYTNGVNEIRVNGETIGEVALDTWYTIVEIVDAATDTCAVYLYNNGAQVASIENKAFTAAKDAVAYITMNIGKTTNAFFNVDNLKLYTYDTYTGLTVSASKTFIQTEESLALTAGYTTPVAGYTFPCTDATYSSDKPEVAIVSDKGVVTGVSAGEAVITVTPSTASGVTTNAMITINVAAEEHTGPYYSEDFENVGGDVKTYLTDQGYKVWNASNYDFSIVEEGDNSYLKIAQNKLQANYLNLHYDLSAPLNKAVLKCRVMLKENAGYFQVRFADNQNNSYKRVVSPVVRNAQLDVLTKSSPETYITPDNNTMQKGVWHELEMIVDTTTKKYDLYLNGVCILNQADTYPSENAAEIDSFTIAALGWTANTYYMDDIQVLPYVEGTAISFAADSPTEVIVGYTEKLKLEVTPADASAYGAVFTSSDPAVATVDAYGNVTGISAGTVTITADPYLAGLANITTQITVTEKVAVNEVNVDNVSVSLTIGGHTYINATVAPESASFKEITFSSSNESVATVDEWGEIVAIGAGSATITVASVDDATKAATINVTVAAASVAQTIYVAPNGTGNGESAAAPTTIAGAMQAIADINNNSTGMTGDIEVVMADGYYKQTSAIAFTDAHSGTNGFKVTWKAAEGAEPVIGGGLFLEGSTFTDADGDGIYEASVPAGTDTRQLFVDNVRVTRARSEGGLTNASFQSAYGILCDDVEIADWSKPEDLEMVFINTWKHSRGGVSSVEKTTDGKLKIVIDEQAWLLLRVWESWVPVWYENAIELLDEPGEWYLDKDENKLYYMPRLWEDMSKVTVTLPVVEDLITVTGSDYDKQAENIYFEGITFADTTWLRPSTEVGHVDTQNNHINLVIHDTTDTLPGAAITVAKANTICFTDCTFTRLGITALKMVDGVQNSMVTGNHFYDISGSAVTIGEPKYLDEEIINPSDKYMVLKNCDVQNNYIHDVAVDYQSAAAVSVAFAADMDLNNNEIFNIPYSGFHIGIGWDRGTEENILRNTVIANNFLHHVMCEDVHDGGGIYTNGFAGENKLITGNYIRYQREPYAAIYFDTGSNAYTVTNNVVDLSEVTENKTGKLPNWILVGQNRKNMTIDGNYVTNAAMISRIGSGYDYPVGDYAYSDDNGNQLNITNTTVCADANWPAEALNIIADAGLESDYTGLRNNQAEIIVTNIPDSGVPLDVNGTFEIEVTYTDGKDNAVTVGDIAVYYEIADDTIATVSAEGVVTGKNVGRTNVRIYVISNDILDVLEGAINVGDTLSEVNLRGLNNTITLPMGIEKVLEPYTTTDLGNTLEGCDMEYSVADTTIASVDATGKLIPAKVGETTMTVKASMLGKEVMHTYAVKVVEAGTMVTYNLAEVFDSVNEGKWYPSNSENLQYVEGKSITLEPLKKFINYTGMKLQNELLHFELEISDINKSGDWPGIHLRAQDYTLSAGTAGYKGYFIGFSSSGLEVYRINGDGTRKAWYSPWSKFNPELGTMDATVFTRDVKHDVQLGAINVVDGVRLLLIIDGVTVLDTIDEYEDGAITEAGYFGLLSDLGHGVVLTKVADASEDKVTAPDDSDTDSDTDSDSNTDTGSDVQAPEIIESATVGSYTLGSNSEVIIKTTGEFAKFESVEMDGEVVEEANYSVKEGSTIVTFKNTYLETLSVGDHTVTINYKDGSSVDTKLNILKKTEANTDNDNNDEEDNESGNADNEAVASDTADTANAAAASAAPTGDDSHLGLWILLLAVAIAACGAIGFFAKKNTDNNK